LVTITMIYGHICRCYCKNCYSSGAFHPLLLPDELSLSRLSQQLSSLSEFLNLVPLTPPPFTRTLEQAMYVNPVFTCAVR
jgi:hypothetical protein